MTTPLELRVTGYSFRQVISSDDLWRRWQVRRPKQPAIVFFPKRGQDLKVEGFDTMHLPEDIIHPT